MNPNQGAGGVAFVSAAPKRTMEQKSADEPPSKLVRRGGITCEDNRLNSSAVRPRELPWITILPTSRIVKQISADEPPSKLMRHYRITCRDSTSSDPSTVAVKQIAADEPASKLMRRELVTCRDNRLNTSAVRPKEVSGLSVKPTSNLKEVPGISVMRTSNLKEVPGISIMPTSNLKEVPGISVRPTSNPTEVPGISVMPTSNLKEVPRISVMQTSNLKEVPGISIMPTSDLKELSRVSVMPNSSLSKTALKLHRCSICKRMFIGSEYLARHISESHSNEATKWTLNFKVTEHGNITVKRQLNGQDGTRSKVLKSDKEERREKESKNVGRGKVKKMTADKFDQVSINKGRAPGSLRFLCEHCDVLFLDLDCLRRHQLRIFGKRFKNISKVYVPQLCGILSKGCNQRSKVCDVKLDEMRPVVILQDCMKRKRNGMSCRIYGGPGERRQTLPGKSKVEVPGSITAEVPGRFKKQAVPGDSLNWKAPGSGAEVPGHAGRNDFKVPNTVQNQGSGTVLLIQPESEAESENETESQSETESESEVESEIEANSESETESETDTASEAESECEVCDFVAAPRADVMTHESKLSWTKYLQESFLQAHMLLHDERTSYSFFCDVCKKKFTDAKSLEQHKFREQHYVSFSNNLNEEDKVNFECGSCGLMFNKQSLLKSHIESLHLWPSITSNVEEKRNVSGCSSKDPGRIIKQEVPGSSAEVPGGHIKKEVPGSYAEDPGCSIKQVVPVSSAEVPGGHIKKEVSGSYAEDPGCSIKQEVPGSRAEVHGHCIKMEVPGSSGEVPGSETEQEALCRTEVPGSYIKQEVPGSSMLIPGGNIKEEMSGSSEEVPVSVGNIKPEVPGDSINIPGGNELEGTMEDQESCNVLVIQPENEAKSESEARSESEAYDSCCASFFICSICGWKFISSAILDSHVRTHALDVKKSSSYSNEEEPNVDKLKSFECGLCGMMFNKQSLLKSHIESMHFWPSILEKKIKVP